MAEFDIASLANDIEDGEIALILAPSEKVRSINSEIVRYYTDNDARCIYVSVSKPSQTLDRHFEKAGIKTDNIFYLDCATSLAGSSGLTRADNVIYLEPSELTNLSIAMSNAVEGMPQDQDRLLLFDTLSTLMIYNNQRTVSKFAHALTSRIRKWGIKSIILTLDEETDDSIKSQLTQFVDRVVHIE